MVRQAQARTTAVAPIIDLIITSSLRFRNCHGVFAMSRSVHCNRVVLQPAPPSNHNIACAARWVLPSFRPSSAYRGPPEVTRTGGLCKAEVDSDEAAVAALL